MHTRTSLLRPCIANGEAQSWQHWKARMWIMYGGAGVPALEDVSRGRVAHAVAGGVLQIMLLVVKFGTHSTIFSTSSTRKRHVKAMMVDVCYHPTTISACRPVIEVVVVALRVLLSPSAVMLPWPASTIMRLQCMREAVYPLIIACSGHTTAILSDVDRYWFFASAYVRSRVDWDQFFTSAYV